MPVCVPLLHMGVFQHDWLTGISSAVLVAGLPTVNSIAVLPTVNAIAVLCHVCRLGSCGCAAADGLQRK